MPDAIDLRLANYAEHLHAIAVPAVRRDAPRRHSPNLSIAISIVALALFSLGGFAAAKFLLPVTSEEVHLSRALGKTSHHPLRIARFIQIDRVDEIRDGDLSGVTRRMSSIARLSEIRESVGGSDVDYAGEMAGGGRFYVMLFKDTRKAADARVVTVADTHGLPAVSSTWFSGAHFGGVLLGLGGLRPSDRDALIRAAKVHVHAP